MTKPQLDNYNMFLAVQNFFNKRESVWISNVPVATTKAKLSALLENLGAELQIQIANNKGIAEAKLKLRKELEIEGFRISSGAGAYATHAQKGNFHLLVYYPKSYYRLLSSAEIQTVCTNLVTNCLTEIEHLEPYGITPEVLTTFTAKINTYAEMITKPKEYAKKKQEATKTIDLLIAEIATLLKTQMDLLMVGFEATQPEFTAIYKNLRRVVKTGVTKLDLVTTTVNAVTLAPIKGAKLEIKNPNIKRETKKSGYSRIRGIKEGKNEIKVSHKDYRPTVVKFTVVKGVTTKLEIKLEPLV